MNYHVSSFTPKHFASQFSETLVDTLPDSGDNTIRLSSVTALDPDGWLSIDTANKWEVVYYSEKNDLNSTVTIPAWGRALRGTLQEHTVGASVKQVPSAEILEYFDRAYPLIEQGMMLYKTGLTFKILPLKARLGSTEITYAGSDQTAPSSATTYYWLDETGTLVTGASYPTTPIIKLGHVVATTAITDIYDDRLVSLSNDIVTIISETGEDYEIPTTKSVVDYVASFISGITNSEITDDSTDFPTVTSVKNYVIAYVSAFISSITTSTITTDSTNFPTVTAVKNWVTSYVSSFIASITTSTITTDSTNFPTVTAVKNYIAGKIATVVSTPSDDYVPTVKALMDYVAEISSGVFSINGKAGAITFAEGDNVTIVEDPSKTFTINSAYPILVEGDNVTITESPSGTFTFDVDVPTASTTIAGTVKIDSDEADPVVLLKSTYDSASKYTNSIYN